MTTSRAAGAPETTPTMLMEQALAWLASLTVHRGRDRLLAALRTQDAVPLLGRTHQIVEVYADLGRAALTVLERAGHPVGPVILVRRQRTPAPIYLLHIMLPAGQRCGQTWDEARIHHQVSYQARLLPLYETIYLPGTPGPDSSVSWLVPPMGGPAQPLTDPAQLAAALAAAPDTTTAETAR